MIVWKSKYTQHDHYNVSVFPTVSSLNHNGKRFRFWQSDIYQFKIVRLHGCTSQTACRLPLHSNEFSINPLCSASCTDLSPNVTSDEGMGQQQDKPQITLSILPLTLASLPWILTTWASKQRWSGLVSTRLRPFWRTTSFRRRQRTGSKWRNPTNEPYCSLLISSAVP